MTFETTSRTIVRFLSHDASAPRDPAGYVPIWYICHLFSITRDMLMYIVCHVAGDRLNLSDCQQFVRTCDGHSTDDIDITRTGKLITDPRDVRYCVHGTTRAAYEEIKVHGLSRRNRQMIHFADSKTLVNKNSEVLIHLDVKRYLSKGRPLYRLRDGTLATPGNVKGIVKTSFFHRVQFL
ncbi:uncharacterized protein LOC117340572 [Pecten maximus]|uniref:uncharacterized protein LOC117340572 n=1 Tax=Pecten maximus TaxID=6579 RepID=UPI001458F2ED|nr:uncharacterized protein LOC117340572 [Pecten maximus]